jgi:hypothetical protein
VLAIGPKVRGFEMLKEGVLRIFIALKNTSPWPGSNPQTLGSVASTLTTTTGLYRPGMGKLFVGGPNEKSKMSGGPT